jgi:transcriptional regulator with XRE-family HTH domain
VSPGQLLREARRRHGVTQRGLAIRAGTTQSAISRIERDQVSPTVETLARLLDLLGEELVLAANEIATATTARCCGRTSRGPAKSAYCAQPSSPGAYVSSSKLDITELLPTISSRSPRTRSTSS